MGRKKKLILVGAGLIGQRHVSYIQEAAELVAIVDPSPTAQQFAQSLSMPLYADLEEALIQEEAQGLILATPNHLHVPHAHLAVEQGLPCLIEKPIAESSDTAADLVKQANAKNIPLLIGHHRRHNNLIQAAKKTIKEGILGDIVGVQANFWLYKPDDYYNMTWRTKTGAGPAFINAIHDLDLLRYLCGEVIQIQAMKSHAQRGFEVEDTLVATLKFENGALGSLSISDTIVAPWSWEFTAKENPAYPHVSTHAYCLGGTKGSLSIPDLKLWQHPKERSWWNPISSKTLPYEVNDPLRTQMAHFLDVIDGKVEPLVSGEEGLKSLQLLEQIQRAAR